MILQKTYRLILTMSSYTQKYYIGMHYCISVHMNVLLVNWIYFFLFNRGLNDRHLCMHNSALVLKLSEAFKKNLQRNSCLKIVGINGTPCIIMVILFIISIYRVSHET